MARGWMVPVLALGAAVPAAAQADPEAAQAVPAAAQADPEAPLPIHRSPPPPGARTHTVVPGPRYAATGLKRWFFGAGYRDLWTAPIEVPVLDLDEAAGGLTVTGTGGFGQTFTLEFRGADGLEYAVRSLDKDPTRRLDPLLRGTLVSSIIQDQVGGFLPTAALVVDPLIDATGLLYPRHRLVVVPDDPRLGPWRERYAGLIGLFVDRPDEGPDGTPGFAGSTRITGTNGFLDELEEGACNRAEAREYLEARLLDMVIGDRDRHAGQWRWASYADGDGCRTWRPIPVDRDQAFIRNDGPLMALFRLIRPQQVKFGPKYPSLLGLTFNGWELDRQILVELDPRVWSEVAAELQAELTDDVIDRAVRSLPAPHYALLGEWLARSIRARRDALPGEALAYYRMITNAPEITATDRAERAVFEHFDDGRLRVTIRHAEGPRSDAPWFDRTFDPRVTDEVRVYLHGGDDEVQIRGGRGRVKVRAIGGGGDDRFVNASRTGRGLTRFYDDRGNNVFEGPGRVDTRSFERPPSNNLVHRWALDWGGVKRFIPIVTYSTDVGLFAGLVAGYDRFGFRKTPWHNRQSFRVGIASRGPEPILGWDGRFRGIARGIDGLVHAEYSGIEILRFHGFGNGTPFGDPGSFFEVEQRELVVAPGLEWVIGYRPPREEAPEPEFRPPLRLGFGPVLKHAVTPEDDNADRFIATLDPAPLGLGSFGQIGGRVWVELDTRDRPAYPTRGVVLRGGGAVFPAVWDVEEAFGEIHGALSTFLTPGSSRHAPTLAVRVGGKKVWGGFPFHEAAFLGGRRDIRGFREQRFAGDAAAWGNLEVRVPLASFPLLFPSEFGVLGAADAGRVFFEDGVGDTDDLHTAFGGGVWLSFLDRRQSLSLSVLRGDHLTGVYLNVGLHF